ncbi:MAG: hypothetical protein KAT30_01890 [Candidatus Krumholzibacteria bacterium]|nr:hypothetical protein [Candidatus Krumholzibacteria bacterium]
MATMIVATGADPTKIRSTARMLELDNNHISPVAKIVSADDILAVAKNIPTAKRIEVLCQACRKRNATDADVEAVREATRNLERVIEISAGDRESFFDLLQGLTYDDVTSRQEESRRLSFRGNSSLWGIRARVTFKTVIHSPNADKPGWIDTVRLGGLLGLTRLRPVPWSLFRMNVYHDDGSVQDVTPHPLDPDIGDPLELPVIREFSSDPLPEIWNITTEYGKRFDIAPGPIGNMGAVDCVFGDRMLPFTDIYCDERDDSLAAIIDLQTPAEVLLFDLFLHRDFTFPTPPDVIHLDRLNTARGYNISSDEWSKLPLSAKVTQLAPGSAGCATPHYPEYSRLLDYAFDKIDRSPLEFRGFRFLLKYPTIPSAVVLRVPKLPRPEE